MQYNFYLVSLANIRIAPNCCQCFKLHECRIFRYPWHVGGVFHMQSRWHCHIATPTDSLPA